MRSLDVELKLPLDSFALEVRFRAEHAITGVFGPSGSGKSSLLEAIAGMRPEASGRIRLGDTEWLDSLKSVHLPPERRGIGYVPQDGLLFPHLDVRGNLLAGARRATGSRAVTLESVAEKLGLAGLLDRSATSLSGGERQRVALGRALCSGPDLLLLDEPLAALELPLRRRLLVLLHRIRGELTAPMLFVSHDPIEIQALCDEVLVLRQGRLVARGTPDRVLSDLDCGPLAGTAGSSGYSNVLSGIVVESLADSARVRLGAKSQVLSPAERRVERQAEGRVESPELVVGPISAMPGEEVLLEVPADRILIATVPPHGLSARNALPATVERIQAGGVTLVHTRLQPGETRMVVEVTESTPSRLGLEPGRHVHLVVKATSCRVHSERAGAT